MKAVNGYSEAKAMNFSQVERLPIGGYILNIFDVKEDSNDYGDVIILAFDIAEGEQKGFFKKQYENSTLENKKWKGTYRLKIPTQKSNSEDDEKKYKRSLGFFKSQIEAIAESNNIKIDCSKEWNINILKNKKVGALFGNKEWEMVINGQTKSGWFTNCDHLINTKKINDGDFDIPKDKPLKEKSVESLASEPSIPNEYEEVNNLKNGDVPF
jgi:hypothetical protein